MINAGEVGPDVELVRAEGATWLGDFYFLRRTIPARQAEEDSRREWIQGVKRRLGLVVADDEEWKR